MNDTAQKWLADGLRGGELEFLDKPWTEDTTRPFTSIKGIDSGSTLDNASPASTEPQNRNHTLHHMKMGARDAYLCLIPQPPELAPPPTSEEPEAEPSLAHSWNLLQGLSGKCLYYKYDWFTYSYCHNHEIRQFRERPQSLINQISGAYQPEEDSDHNSYILGKAPSTPEPGADLTVAEQNAIAANVALAKGAGSRYLVQRWGDGTMCELIGRSREVEVQFHCSMTTGESILFVKEVRTCSYLVVINTPRLCGEPGFRSALDLHQETPIRCRQIVATIDPVKTLKLPLPDTEAAHPFAYVPQERVIAPPPKAAKDKSIAAMQQVLNTLLGGKGKSGELPKGLDLSGTKFLIEKMLDDGSVALEIADELPEDVVLDGYEDVEEGEETLDVSGNNLLEILRAAGYDVHDERTSTKKDAENAKGYKRAKSNQAEDEEELPLERDEL